MSDQVLKIKGLVIAPTREIAIQIYEYFCLITKDLDLVAGLLIGGIEAKEQTKFLQVRRP